MATHDLVSVCAVVVGAVISLVRLWLRLRFRLRSERERRCYLQTAAALPAGSRVRDQREDGTQLTITVGGATGTNS